MYPKILSILRSNAIFGQILSDNRYHSLIRDDQMEAVAAEILVAVCNAPLEGDEKSLYGWTVLKGENVDIDEDDLMVAHV